MSFSGVTDVCGYGGSHKVRTERVSDNTVILDWAPHISGTARTGLSLQGGIQYQVLVRAIDDLGAILAMLQPGDMDNYE